MSVCVCVCVLCGIEGTRVNIKFGLNTATSGMKYTDRYKWT